MKIANIDFPDIVEGGLMFMPEDTENGWVCGFALTLSNVKTGKAKFTNFRIVDFTSQAGDISESVKWPDTFSNEELKDLLRIAFILEEPAPKNGMQDILSNLRTGRSICDKHPLGWG